MTTTSLTAPARATSTPTEKMLTVALVVAPVLSLVADSTYAARGWSDSIAGVLHVIGAIAFGFVVLRVARWLAPASRLGAAVLLTGLIGMAGNVAYGFDTIHMSLGDTALVRQPGAANLIKPLGLFFPLSLLLIAIAIYLLHARWQGILIAIAAIGWPISHIGNIAPLAVAVNVLLVVAFGALAWRERSTPLGGDTAPAIG